MSVRPPVLIPPAPLSQETVLDPNGFPIDTARPKLQNPDGSISTEISITVEDPALNGGRPTNIPTVWNGREVSEDEAVRLAASSGQAFPAFGSIDEAVAAAQARSAEIGRVRGVDAPPAPGLLDALLPPAAKPLDALLQPRERTLPAVLDGVAQGAPIAPDEFTRLVGALEQGAFDDPRAVRTQLAGVLAPEAMQAVDDAIAVQQIVAAKPADSPIIPGGPSAEAFLRGAVRGATLNMVDPTAGAEQLDPNLARAVDLSTEAQRSAHPIADLGGEAAGSILPFAKGVQLLRAFRASRALPALEGEARAVASPMRDLAAPELRQLEGLDAQIAALNTRGVVPTATADIVKEGAVVGGPLSAAYRPEGADQMSAGEELTARAMQGGIGVAAGALLDFTVIKAGDFAKRLYGAGRDALQVRALTKEAQSKGFESPDEYMASLVDFEQTPQGLVVRPRAEALRNLPGEADPVPVDLDAAAPPRAADPNAPDPAAPAVLRFDELDPSLRAENIDAPVRRGESLDEAPPVPAEPRALPEPAPAPVVDRTPIARRAQAEEYDRLARATTDPTIRQELLRQAQTLRTEAKGEPPKLTPQERTQRARRIDTENDDIVTAIRKLGGLDVSYETDWAGRLSHLPRKGFGLPGIEQVRGGGRTLDDLAEQLTELGYLSRRDLSELETKLAQAETGAELFSARKQNYAEPERPPTPRSSDNDWTYGTVDDVRNSEHEFVIDTDNGTVIPSRPLDEADWSNLYEEERNAQQWFESEGGADVEPRGDGEAGLPTGLADQVQGRDGYQPESGDSFGLPGVESRSPTRQGLADLERAQDLRRNGARDVAVDEGAGDLFGARARQRDLTDGSEGGVAREPAGELAAPAGDRGGFELHANPITKTFAATAREVVREPGRSAAEAFVGGVGGATTSDDEVGSAGWWLDVAKGSALGIAGFQGARAAKLIGKGSIIDRGMGKMSRAIERLPLIGRGPEELREFKRKQRVMRQIIDRQTEAAGSELLRRFSPEERAMMSDLIESRGIVQDFNIVHRQAQALDDYISEASERMKALGMLPDDLETGGYLHRYYAKHLGLDKLFREAKGQSLSGSYTIARGTDGAFDRNYLSPGARAIADDMDALLSEKAALEAELSKGLRRQAKQKTPDMVLEKRIEEVRDLLEGMPARRKEISAREMVEFVGMQNGEPRSFLFTRAEVPRADTGFDPRFAQKDRPDVKPGDLTFDAMPEAPGVEGLADTGRTWTLRGTKERQALMHRDWTKAERQAWGEIDDAGYRYVRGMAEVSHDLSLATLYSTVARRGDWVRELGEQADTVVNGQKWIYVPDAKVNKASPLRKYGELAGKHVRADVWNGIRNYGRPAFAPGPLGSVYRQALSKWKLYKTVYNPVTHLNNTYSNFEMLYMSGYKPTDIAHSLKAMYGGESNATWREARDAGLFGTDWSTSLTADVEGGGNQVLSDLAEKLRTQPQIPDAELSTSIFMDVKDWWINSRNAVRDADTKLASGAAMARALSEPVVKGAKFINRPVKVAARSAQRLYRFEDEVFKLAVFQAERKAGKSAEEAVQAAERLFFDYSDLPEAVKIIRDFPVGAPFISYTYFAVPAIARNIVHNPERVLALAAGYEAWNYAALEATSDDMGPGEYWATQADIETVSASWERGRALWGALNTLHMPSPEGYRLAIGRSHALGNPFMSEAGGREKLPNAPTSFWGSSAFGGNPLHALLDTMVNEDWKGKEIYLKGDTAETKARKIGAYLFQAWAPSNILMPGGYQQTKLIEGMANDTRKAREAGEPEGIIGPVVDLANQTSEALGFGQFTGLDRADNEINTRDQLLSSFGIKLRPIRFEQSTDFELSDIDREIKAHDDVVRKAAREEGAGRTTRAQFEQTDDEQGNEIDKLIEKGRGISDARRRLDEKGLLR